MTLLLRVILAVVVAAIVLAIAYVVVTDPGSGTDVTARGHRSPVQAQVGHAVELGRGRAVMASGPAGLWVARQPPTGSPGEVERIDTDTGKPEHAYRLNILPQGIAVGRGVIWVLGSKRADGPATLLRIDPASGRVQHRLQLAEQSSCATEKFASCYPVATHDGVWVPLLSEIVHVDKSGAMADRTAQVNGHVWDLTGSDRPAVGAGRDRDLPDHRAYSRPPADRPHDRAWASVCSPTTSPATATRCGSRATRATPPRTPVA